MDLRKIQSEIRKAVRQGWCYPKTKHKEMDKDLAEAITLSVLQLFRFIEEQNQKLKEALEKIKAFDVYTNKDSYRRLADKIFTITDEALKE